MTLIASGERQSNTLIFASTIFFSYCVQKNPQIWCVSVRASLHMRREEKPTRRHWMVYCTYNLLNMFRALLCPSSEARDYMCFITACSVQCLGCWLSEVRCRQQAMRPEWGMLWNNIPHPGIFPGGKGGRCVGLTNLPTSCAECTEIREPQSPGTLRVWDCFTFIFTPIFTIFLNFSLFPVIIKHWSELFRCWNTVGFRFTTALPSRIFGCKTNRRKTSTI